MLEYVLSDDDRAAMAPYHRMVQAAIARIANLHFGLTDVAPKGIAKHEGGVRVNGREIVIHPSNVRDDWRRALDETAEERAVVTAINAVTAMVRIGGPKVLERYGMPESGDPLRAMFNFRKLE